MPRASSRAHADTKTWKLSPSDFAFLWEECKRCFHLKVARGIDRPRTPMPKIFTLIDARMKDCYRDSPTSQFLPGLPPGRVESQDALVESRPIAIRGHSTPCYVRGKLDTVIKFDQGGYAVVDFKTSETKDDYIPLYGRQLHAYAYALEHPAPGRLGLEPITRLGLLVFAPTTFSHASRDQASLSGGMTWIEVPRNDGRFLDFLREVVEVLDRDQPPAAAGGCKWCSYRDTGRRSGL